MMNLYQERDFGQVINATVEFIKLNLKPLAYCLLLVALPVTLGLTLLSRMLLLSSLNQSVSGDVLDGVHAVFSVSYWGGIGLTLVSHLFLTGTVYGYMLEYESGNADIRPAHIWPRLVRSLPGIVFPMLLAGLITLISVFFFVLPALYFFVSFSLLLMIRMREGSTSVPIVRSTELLGSPWWSPVTGSPFLFWLLFIPTVRARVANYWATLALIGVSTFLLFVLQGLVSAPALMMGLSDGLFNTKLSLSSQSQPLMLVLSLVQTVVGTFTGAILPLALGFQYYNLLDQRDGGGVLSAVETIGQQAVGSQKQSVLMAQIRTEDEGDY